MKEVCAVERKCITLFEVRSNIKQISKSLQDGRDTVVSSRTYVVI